MKPEPTAIYRSTISRFTEATSIKELGVLFEVISKMLAERGIDMKLTGLVAPKEKKVF